MKKANVKKLLSVIMSAVTVISVFAGLNIMSAAENNEWYDTDVDGIRYEVSLKHKTAGLSHCSPSVSGDVVIPSTVDGYPVTYIAAIAFSFWEGEYSDMGKNITSLTLPEGVTSISQAAFAGLTNVKTITLPASLDYMSDLLFPTSGALEQVIVSKNNPHFYNDKYGVLYSKSTDEDGEVHSSMIISPACNNAVNYRIPDGTTFLCEGAFINNKNLETVYVPDGCYPSDYDRAKFISCPELKYVRVPSGASVRFFNFENCPSLKGMEIPEGAVFPRDEDGKEDLTEKVCGYNYNYDEASGTVFYTKIEDFEIYGVPGSDAEKYAEIHGFKFIAGHMPVSEANPELKANGSDKIKIDSLNKTLKFGGETTADTLNKLIANEKIEIKGKDGKILKSADLAGTGATVSVLNENGKVLSTYTALVPNDVNGDGKISAVDARAVLRASAELDKLSGVYLEAADSNGDGKIQATDARTILRISAGLEKPKAI